MDIMNGLVDIVKSICAYKTVNKLSGKNLRNRSNGIKLIDAIYYRFLYSEKNTTKQHIASKINEANNTNPKHEDICIAVDGTYNTNNEHDIMLNMGLYDTCNHIPIYLDLTGKKDRNNEVLAIAY